VGTPLVVVAGHVTASGYDWIKVAPIGVELRAISDAGAGPAASVDQGWVAVADHDGTPWVAVAADPTPGYELASATVDRSAPSLAAARAAAAAQNAFGLTLYRQMLADPALQLGGKGVVLSPTSVAMALGMARAGAKGRTATEMDAVLHLDGWSRYASGLGALDQEIRSRDATWQDGGGSHQVALRMADTAFGQRGYTIDPAYLERIGSTFGSPLALVDYVGDPTGALDAINGWVSRQTMARIPKLLSPTSVSSSTRLVLVNAVYLKAPWAAPFEPELTRDRAFTTLAGGTVSVPTMRMLAAALPVAHGTGWRATELRYLAPEGGSALSLTVVMPDDIDAFERSLTPSVLASVDTSLRTEWDRVTKVHYGNPNAYGEDCGSVAYVTNLDLPKFGIDTRGNLVPALRAAGMPTAVSDAADFTGINPEGGLSIAMVIHQANIDVDEVGTEAAAATAVGMDTTGGCGGPVPQATRTLRLNHAFLFMLRDTQTGAILFMGRVADPTTR
jgi:serpin B